MELIYWIAERLRYKSRTCPKGISGDNAREWLESEERRESVHSAVVFAGLFVSFVVTTVVVVLAITRGR